MTREPIPCPIGSSSALCSQPLADTGGNRVASGTGASEPGALAETTLGKGGPDLTQVVTTSESRVGVQDGVTGLDEVGVAGLAVSPVSTDTGFQDCSWGDNEFYLQSHAVDDQLQREELSVGGHTVRVESRLLRRAEAVLVNQVPHDLVQHRRPDLADIVNLVVLQRSGSVEFLSRAVFCRDGYVRCLQ